MLASARSPSSALRTRPRSTFTRRSRNHHRQACFRTRLPPRRPPAQQTEIFLNVIEVTRSRPTPRPWLRTSVLGREARRTRRAMKKAVTQARRSGAKGIKVMRGSARRSRDVSPRGLPRGSRSGAHPPGRYRLRLCRGEATYGIIGVKVWIFKGGSFQRGRAQPEHFWSADVPQSLMELSHAQSQADKDPSATRGA